ncbi:uncharacterized protein LOC122572426 [Bombus pyrosoma]|uniref:uncharacterized protein LOC122572426 n=1 Tax=Bombus pyrosoma TaxID=396416 RepID=UPI001CB90CBA|nr:uncharacterized protein LOC122572426 [Bombus pyrosoma]
MSSVKVDQDYKKGVNLSIRSSRWILKLIGVWPNSRNVSAVKKYFHVLLNAIYYALIMFLLLPGSLYVIFEVEDVYNRIKLFGPLSFCVMALLKYYLLILHEEDIRECVERIEWDWKNITYPKDRELMMTNANFGRKLVITCTFFMYSGFIFFYIAVPMSVERIPVEGTNATFIPMVFPFSRFIIDTRYSPTNEIVFSIQFLAGALMHGITSAACSLAAIFAVHACGQMQVLMTWLNHLIDGRLDMHDCVDQRIAKVVSQHVRILKFLSLIEKALQQVSYVEFLGCTLDICLLGYYIIMEWNSNHLTDVMTYSVLLVSLTFNIFIFCYIGELVADKSRKVGEMTYMIEWYRLYGKKKLCCVLIIAMSDSSRKLTAGNIVELSMSTFSDVITNGASYLTTDHDCKRNVDLSIRYSRWILKPIGVWPTSPNIFMAEKYFYRFINTICYSLICFLLVPCSLYLILEVKDVYNRIKLFGPLSFCVMAFLKYHLLILHEDDIRECIKRIEWDWKNITYSEDREIMITNANFGRRLVIICAFFMYSGFAFYYIAIPISVGKIPAGDVNVTFIPLVFPFSRFIMDTRYSPINEIVFSLQLVSGCLMHSITSAACSLAAIFAVHACGQMQVLTSWLKHLIDGRPDMYNNVDSRIASVVSQHVRILNFLALTEKTLQQVSFVEFIGCMLNICLLGYYVIMEWSSSHLTSAITFFILLISLTFNIFIFCYIGEVVAEQCKKIGETSYMVDWYRISGTRKLCFVLIIAMANSSIKLTAGNMVELCLTTFSDIVKTAVAFLNVLRTLT